MRRSFLAQRPFAVKLAALLGGVAALVAGLLTVTQIFFELQTRPAEIAAQNLQIATLVSSRVDDLFEGAYRDLEALAADPELVLRVSVQDADRLNRRLEAISPVHPDVTGIFVVNRQGQIIAASLRDKSRIVRDASDRRHVRAILDEGAARARQAATRGAASGLPVVPIGVAVRDSEGQPIGVITAGVSLARLADALESVELDGDAHISVVDEDGTLLVTRDRSLILMSSDLDGTPVAEALRGSPATGTVMNRRGQQVYSAAVPVASLPGAAQIQIPIEAALSPLYEASRRALVVAGLGLAVAVILGIWMARRIARPITLLRSATVRLASGDFAAPLPPILTGDEFEALAADFAAMRGALARRTSEREEAATALRQSEAEARKLALVASNTHDAVVIVDRAGRIEWANASIARLTGYDPDAIVGQPAAMLLEGPETDRATLAAMQEHRQAGRPYAAELRAHRRSGEPCWIAVEGLPIADAEGAVQRYILIGRDVTPRKDAEDRQLRLIQQAEAAEARLRIILDLAPDSIVLTDATGVITLVNGETESCFGYARAELIGQPIQLLIKDQLSARAPRLAALGEAIEPPWEAGFRRELVGFHKNGGQFPVEVSSSATDIDGQRIVTIVVRDISERRAVERLKDEFVSMVSHEIRTPMNGVIGMTELLLGTPLTAQQRSFAQAIRRSGESLLRIVNDILDLSKIEAGKLDLDVDDVDVRATIDDVSQILAEEAHRKGLELACFVDHDVPRRLWGDPVRVRQVLMNLVGNAVKFTEQGEVVVRASLQAVEGATAELRVEVRDTGPGISPEDQARLFQPFSRIAGQQRAKAEGTGLGLAICRQLTELMGGGLGLTSTPGEGSLFWFTVRLGVPAEVGAAVGDCSERVAASPVVAAQRVMVIDDHEPSRSVVCQWVTAWGIACDEAASATVALKRLRALAADPTDADGRDVLAGRIVAIVDQTMVDMCGLDFIRIVRGDRRLAALRIVLLMPAVDDTPADVVASVGADAVLVKPLRESQLLDALAGLLADELTVAAAVAAPGLRSPAVADPVPPVRSSMGQILVVEDSAINQTVAVGILARLGYRVDVVENGLEAVQAAGNRRYAAILMDCQMPLMDGYEATAEIRRREDGARRVPIIAMTAHAMKGARERCLAAGMDDYLAKPVRVDDVRRVLSRWVAGGRVPPLATQPATPPGVPLAPRPATSAPEPPGRWHDGAHRARSDRPVEPDRSAEPGRSALGSRSDDQGDGSHAPGGRSEDGAASPALAVIDRDMVENLRRLQAPGRPDIVATLAAKFVEHAPSLVRDVKDATRRDDRERVATVTHILTGDASTWGAHALVRACAELEAAAQTPGASLEDRVAEIDAALLDVLADLTRLSRGAC